MSFHHRTVRKRLVALDIGHPQLVRFETGELAVNQVHRGVYGAGPPSGASVTY